MPTADHTFLQKETWFDPFEATINLNLNFFLKMCGVFLGTRNHNM